MFGASSGSGANVVLRFSAYPPHTAEELMTDCEGFGPDCTVELERF